MITVLAWLAVASALAWVWLTFARGFFWRTDQRLPAGRPPAKWPEVAVVVPARNEAALLPETLPSLLRQRYPGRVRVLLVDDGSTDDTGGLARRLGASVVDAGEPPVGWAGKVWALRAGVAAAGPADYLLLTDADIRHGADSLRALVAAAVSHDLDLVSQMAWLRVRTRWERLIVPAFVYFFGMLFPFRWVNRPGTRTAAAAGGCILVRRGAMPDLAALSGAVIDDVALARAVKRRGGRLWLGLAGDVRSIRPYPTLGSLWRMISRSAYSQLNRSPVLLAATVLGLTLVFLVPPAATVAGAVTGRPAPLAAGGLAWLAMAGTFAPMLRRYGQPVAGAALLPGTAFLYLLMTVHSALRPMSWKGREPASMRRPARQLSGE